MFIPQYNIYINEDNRILFDLLTFDIYDLNEEFYNGFIKLYKGAALKLLPDIEKYIQHRNPVNSIFDKFTPRIDNIKLNVSHGCNLRCSYCYAGQGNYGDNRLFMKEIIADRVTELIDNYITNIKSITFFGGEPTLNPKMIKYFCEKYPHLTFMMQTNGTNLLNPTIMNLILKYNFKVTVSIDGPKEIHDKYRRDIKNNPTYERILDNVKKIQMTNPDKILSIQATYSPSTNKLYSKKEIAKQIYRDFGIPNIAVNDVWEVGTSNYVYNIVREEIEEDFEEFLNEQSYFMRTNTSDILSYFFSKEIDWFHFCEAGLELLSIDPNGNIWPCHLFVNTSEKITNIVNEDINYVWKKIMSYPEIFHSKTKVRKECELCIARFRCVLCKRTNENPYQEISCKSKREETKIVFDLIAKHHDRIEDIVSKLDRIHNII